jgi:hypothetical protein
MEETTAMVAIKNSARAVATFVAMSASQQQTRASSNK